jgi:sulfur carrier protein ThiS adenylyltransferase
MEKFKEAISSYIGEEALKKIQAVKIGIAGAGGLGSNCALNLTRVGFRKFKIIDFDVIDHSNLNRQFYFSDQVGMNKVEALRDNLKRINPDIEIEAIVENVDELNAENLFKDCDIIVEAFDKAENKSMLVSKLLKLNKLIVSASGLAGFGGSDNIKTHRVKENLIIIGDLESDVKDYPPLSPRVNVAAAKQADVILEYVLERGKK